MISKNISIMVLVVLIFVILTNTTNAYFTTAQSESTLTPITAMYTITYAFGLPKQDLYMPLITQRNLHHGESDNILGYSIRDTNDEMTTVGQTAGIVLSNAEIKDGMYFIPAGVAKQFTFVTFLRTENTTPENNYSLQVENLPFLVDVGSDALDARGLNPSELQYYVTDSIPLNTTKTITKTTTVVPVALQAAPNGK